MLHVNNYDGPRIVKNTQNPGEYTSVFCLEKPGAGGYICIIQNLLVDSLAGEIPAKRNGICYVEESSIMHGIT